MTLIQLINGTKKSTNYSGGNAGGYQGIQRGLEQKKAGLIKYGFVGLRHKESGDILLPEVKYEWCKGLTHIWWDSNKNEKREAGAWGLNDTNKTQRDFIIKCLKDVFRSKPKDYQLILFSLKDGMMLKWCYTGSMGNNGINYGGPCPMTREDMDKIDQTIVLASTFCDASKEKVLEKDWVSSMEIKEV